MKKHVVVLLALVVFGCAQKPVVKAPEVVASCFGDGENQDMCKAERINDQDKVVTTRCIGAQNRNALASLRGKCVEKICSKGSNTDCQLRGEVAVLDQYSELKRHQYFAEEEQSENATPAKKIVKGKKGKAKKAGKDETAPAADLDVDPTAQLPKMPVKEEPVAAKPAAKPVAKEPAEPAQINVSLKPDTSSAVSVAASKRKPANAAAAPAVAQAPSKAADAEGFKKVCVSKKDVRAPQSLRGKCATRTCNEGKCTYGGRKEMFDYLARSGT
ncbi:hypothetical protein [Bdellovibrio sp. HCB209]|uniref:hypothetical protein n=1 Tax=Bdellovibrio sp. HCB209 TaxID=3394354 RepID=UPI0039B425A0